MSGSRSHRGLVRTVVRPEHDGLRIDVYLGSATALSRRAARRLLSGGAIWLNGRAIRVQSRKLAAGDVVDILQPEEELGIEAPVPPPPPTVLYSDSWLLAVAKPPGVLSAAAERMRPGELSVDQQVLLHAAHEEGRRPYLRQIHRLDRTTSGVMLFSRHSEANRPLSETWASGRAQRIYLAIVEGRPAFEKKTVEEPIARDRSHDWRFAVDPRGKPAATEIEVVAKLAGDLALVRCALVTGRTHQVRVHLSSSGHPVYGDSLYGSTRQPRPARALLHARSVSLPHPRTGKPLHITCPVPEDMAEYLDQDGRQPSKV